MVSEMREYSSKTSAHCIELLFQIFTWVHPFLPRGERVVWQCGKGVNLSPIPHRIHAQKGEATAHRVRAELQFLGFRPPLSEGSIPARNRLK